MGWGFGSTLEGGGGFSRVTLDLTRVMERESNFETMWCGEVCLKTGFLVLYNIALVKEVSVATNMDLSSGTIH